MNYTQQPKIVDIPKGGIELLSSTGTKKNIRLDIFEVAVVLMEQ